MQVLQTIVMPNFKFGAPEDMYVRLHNQNVLPHINSERMLFNDGGSASFDTFFNSVSLSVWKEHCQLNDLMLKLSGEGRFIVRLGLHRIGCSHFWLDEFDVTLKNEEPVTIDVKKFQDLDVGMLYFSLRAIGEAQFTGAEWVTSTPARQEVRLGIVITHFNRKKFVLPAMKRITEELLQDVNYQSKVDLIVVDNSQNIDKDEAYGATIVPNKNLGGSGGFMRGLLYLQDKGERYTHCLFMDDDASCEIESIRRTYAMLSFAQTERLSVAGSMLRELEPYRLFEKGALFHGLCQPLKSGLDMRQVHDLLMAELTDRTPDYGGWWFYAFPINGLREYAFPFFVRGDDIRFGLANRFPICTMNGITSWGDDFALKSGALPLYLDTRNHLIHGLTIQNKGAQHGRKIAKHFVVGQLFSYNYASARAARMAIQHVMKGPEFFVNNMDMAAIRHEIGSFSSDEKMQPFDRQSYHVVYASPHEKRRTRWLRKLSLNGFLLPKFMLFPEHETVFQHKSFHANFNETFRFQQVIHEYEPMRLGYLARFNRKRFFSEYYIYLKTLLKFTLKYKFLQRKYHEAMPNLTSADFWQDVYSD